MRYLICGGGTAGHINPAIAIASQLKKTDPSAEILFVGTKTGLESKLVPSEGYGIEYIDVKGLKRKLTLENIKILYKAVTAVNAAKKVIKKFLPDIVIGTGGYVSGPVVKAAQALRIKTVIHEQNAYWGVTTKLLAKRADKILLSFPPTAIQKERYKNTVVTGNPVRSDFGKFDKTSAKRTMFLSEEKPLLLVYGGSLGAKTINDSMVSIIKQLKKDNNISVVMGVGARDSKEIQKKLDEIDIPFEDTGDIRIVEYIYDMPRIMAAADLIIARSGAITLAEIAMLHKPAILIPSPNVTENHQYHNAKVFSDKGAAILIKDEDVSGQVLYKEINETIRNAKKLQDMSSACKSLAYENAAEKIVKIIKEVMAKA